MVIPVFAFTCGDDPGRVDPGPACVLAAGPGPLHPEPLQLTLRPGATVLTVTQLWTGRDRAGAGGGGGGGGVVVVRSGNRLGRNTYPTRRDFWKPASVTDSAWKRALCVVRLLVLDD